MALGSCLAFGTQERGLTYDWQSRPRDGRELGDRESDGIGLRQRRRSRAIGSRREGRRRSRSAHTRSGGDRLAQADVTDAAQVRTLVHRTVAAFGGLDYAFNNGGSGGKGRLTAEMDERDWDATIDGYLKSVWLCMKYEILEMLKRGGGVIVNNSSVDGLGPILSSRFSLLGRKHGVVGDKVAALEYVSRRFASMPCVRVGSDTTGRSA